MLKWVVRTFLRNVLHWDNLLLSSLSLERLIILIIKLRITLPSERYIMMQESGVISIGKQPFNKTIEKIRASVHSVSDNAVSMKEVGASLATNVSQTASAINEISANIENVKKQILYHTSSVVAVGASLQAM